MKLSLKKYVFEGDPLSRGYGVAYWKIGTLQAVCYPVPLNFLIAKVRNFYIRIICPKITESEQSKIYNKGFQDGYYKSKLENFERDVAKEVDARFEQVLQMIKVEREVVG